MRRLRIVAKRLSILVAVIVVAASINFIVPRASPNNPIAHKLSEHAESGARMNDIRDLVRVYEERFGLDRPIWEQYVNYLTDLIRFDLGYSISFFPTTVGQLIVNALPWTIGLVLTATLIAFAIGTLLGAAISWRGTPRAVKAAVPAFMVLAALPFYLMGLVLLYIFAFTWRIFPISGGYSIMTFPSWNMSFALEVLRYSTLPALSIVLASIGSWALAMRGMMVTVQGEDYMVYAEANGIRPSRRFFSYGLRNAMLPQFTALALQIGTLASGTVLVERIFNYPGLGMVLFNAIEAADYFVVYGVVYVIILMVAVTMMLVDLVTPLVDPRVKL